MAPLEIPVAGPTQIRMRVAQGLDGPEDKQTHGMLTSANLCRLRRQWPQAIDHCVAVLRLEPGNYSAHSLLGDIYLDQGRLEDAIRWFKMAVELKPDSTDAAKIERLERERLRLAGSDHPVAGWMGSGLSSTLNPAGETPAGTVNLMGFSPRRWLNALTAASVVFAGIMILSLVAFRFLAKTPPGGGTQAELYAHAAPVAADTTFNLQTDRTMPYVRPNPSITGNANGGSGFPADSASDSSASIAYPAGPAPAETRVQPAPVVRLPLAPVIGVKPLPRAFPTLPGMAPRTGSANGQKPRDVPDATPVPMAPDAGQPAPSSPFAGDAPQDSQLPRPQ